MDIDLYAFFNISETSSEKEIKKAYKNKAKELHPDKNRDNENANQDFQQLKIYCDILLDPSQRKDYDLKWNAKREAKKRHVAMDETRRKMKEDLEAREAAAEASRKVQREAQRREKEAAELRHAWQKDSEEAFYRATAKRQREKEEAMSKARENLSNGAVLRVKWDYTKLDTVYSVDFIRTCMSEFGAVTGPVMGQRGSAIIEFDSSLEAVNAFDAALAGRLGYPTNPLRLEWISGEPGSKASSTAGANINNSSYQRHYKGTNVASQSKDPSCFGGMFESSKYAKRSNVNNFDDFEADILAQMTNFT